MNFEPNLNVGWIEMTSSEAPEYLCVFPMNYLNENIRMTDGNLRQLPKIPTIVKAPLKTRLSPGLMRRKSTIKRKQIEAAGRE